MDQNNQFDAEEFLDDHSDVVYEEIELPGGKTVKLGTVSGEDLLNWVHINVGDDSPNKMQSGARLIAISIVNKDGTRGNIESWPKVLKKSADTFKKLQAAAFRVNGMGGTKESVKNDSGETATSVSPTA